MGGGPRLTSGATRPLAAVPTRSSYRAALCSLGLALVLLSTAASSRAHDAWRGAHDAALSSPRAAADPAADVRRHPPLARVNPATGRNHAFPKLAPFSVGKTRYFPYRFEGHVHTLHSRDARQTTVDILHAAERLGLDALIITDHGSSAAQRDFAAYQGPLVPFIGREIGGDFGHAVMWNVAADDQSDPTHTTLAQRCRFAHEHGGLLVFAHPGWWIEGNERNPMDWMTPEAMRHGGAAGDIDAIELWNGVYRSPLPGLIKAWEGLLAAGIYVPIVGNSDFHRFGAHHIGQAHNLVFCDQPEPATCLWSSVRQGRSVVTDGAFATLIVNDQLPGSVVTPRDASLDVSVDVMSPDGGELRLYVGPRVVRSVELAPEERTQASWRLATPSSDSYVRIEIVRLAAVRGRPLISLLSNPVLIDVGDKHVWR